MDPSLAIESPLVVVAVAADVEPVAEAGLQSQF